MEFPPGTLVDIFLDSVERYPDRPALATRSPQGTWSALTRRETAERIRRLSSGLRGLGIERGDHVAILSNTRLEWALADWTCLLSGAVGVTVYPNLTPGQVLYILRDADVRAAFVENQEQVDKIAEIRGELPGLERLIAFDAEDDRGLSLVSLEELERRGEAAAPKQDEYERFVRRAEPGEVATLIYTSGTTGDPKGVMLTHRNLYTNTIASTMTLPIGENDRALSWLPLSHALERTAGHFVMWHAGSEIAYAESVSTVARDMMEVRPTVMIGVPRMYEKFYDAVVEAVAEKGWVARQAFRLAQRAGNRYANRSLAGGKIGALLKVEYYLAERAVFRKLCERTGGRVRYFVSGAAPLSPDIARFFYSAGLVVLEGYGLTETSPVTNVNPPHDIRFGTVGPPIPGTEIRIADDGEIMVRGPQVMKGYFGRPAETREAIEPEGWFHTGDIGELDPDGYLKITDRKKNIIVTAAGKNVAPQPIEERIARSPFVDQVVVLGDRRKFPLALVVPSFQAFKIGFPGQVLTRAERRSLIGRTELRQLVEADVFPRVAGFARFERPKRILLIADPFSVENGQLTPTLKPKRRAIEAAYADAIEALYEAAEAEEPS